MNDGRTPVGGSSSFIKPNSPSVASMPGMGFFGRNFGAPPPQPSLTSQIFQGIQNSFPGRVLQAGGMAVDEAQKFVKQPIAAAAGKWVSSEAANALADNVVSFATPAVPSMMQSMNKFLQSGGKQGAGDASLTMTKEAVSKMGPMASLLVKQASIMEAAGGAFYDASQAQKQKRSGMGI